MDGSEPALLCPEGSACPLERLTALQSPPWFCALGRGDLFVRKVSQKETAQEEKGRSRSGSQGGAP